ncbi:MAG: peptidoglycan-binding domain-containing protein [Bacteroidota bacterium]
MKRVAVALVIIILAVICSVQFFKLRRLSPPEDYEYVFREDIDLDYHNPVLVREYYDTGYMVGSFAREMWHSRGINVRLAESDDAANRNAVLRYNRLRAYTDSLGARLAQSRALKEAGFNNADIATMEAERISPQTYRVRKLFGEQTLIKGEKNNAVWELQGRLIARGYEIPHDGYYWTETEEAVRDLQAKNGLFPSGMVHRETLQLLLNQSDK